jgi:hypothetical protein
LRGFGQQKKISCVVLATGYNKSLDASRWQLTNQESARQEQTEMIMRSINYQPTGGVRLDFLAIHFKARGHFDALQSPNPQA